MKYSFIFIAFLISNITWGQEITSDKFDHSLVNQLLFQKINELRDQQNLAPVISNIVLEQASQHHASYMSQSTIVSHYQEMNLVKQITLFGPRDRIDYFAQNIDLTHNVYAEICLGIRLKKVANHQILAEKLFEELVKSENHALLINPQAQYLGTSVEPRKNTYYLAINIGMGYNNSIALLE
ncbi:MAG: CAP domain-containing protein [Candidatus Cyclobacteriaceae bacterium M3_2C_046]